MAAPLAVLLVEDEPYTLEIMATLVRAQGQLALGRAVSAARGEALDAVRSATR